MNPKPLPSHQFNSAVPNNIPPSEVATAVPGSDLPCAQAAEGTPPHPHANKNPLDKVFSLPESEIEDGSIEAGLLCLSHWMAEHSDRILSRAEIAHVCGCSETLIAMIEQGALRRVKRLYAEILRNHASEDERTHPRVPASRQTRNHP